MKSKLFSLLFAVMLGCVPLQLLAENSTRVPGYVIHHNAFTTDTLAPEVARSYGLQRSKSRGMLNVSVIKEVPGTTGLPVSAKVQVSASNLTGQTREIPMREIHDGNSYYYIGDFRVADQETLSFTLEVTPQGEAKPFPAQLSQQFFIH